MSSDSESDSNPLYSVERMLRNLHKISYPEWTKSPPFESTACKQHDLCFILVNPNNYQEFLLQTRQEMRLIGGVDLQIITVDARAHSHESPKVLCSVPAPLKQSFCHSHAVCKTETNEVYLYDRARKEVDVINFKRKKRKVICKVPYGDNFIVIANQIYIINNVNDYCIGNIQRKRFVRVHDTLSKHELTNGHRHKTVYVSSKQCILLLPNNTNRYCATPPTKYPWTYCLKTQKWKQIRNVSFEDLSHLEAVLTSNQRYVVIFAENASKRQTVSILDMKDDSEWKIKKCNFNVPKRAHNNWGFVLRTGGIDSHDETLVIGFIRDSFEEKEFEDIQLPPMYLMKLVEEKYSAEIIHIVFRDRRKRWLIYLKDILDSLV